MINITVNKKKYEVDKSATLEDVVKKYYKEMNIVAAKVNGKSCDLSNVVENNSNIELIKSDDKDGLDIIRHSCAHVFGHVIKQLYPDVKMVMVPLLKMASTMIFCLKNLYLKMIWYLLKIEWENWPENYSVIREVISKEKAIKTFQQRDEEFKVKLLEEIPSNEIIALYHHEEYVDMCRGPHVTNTSHLKAFKLMKTSGSYWKGDSNNQPLTRVYGTAWSDEQSLKEYIHQLEEAEKETIEYWEKNLIYFISKKNHRVWYFGMIKAG